MSLKGSIKPNNLTIISCIVKYPHRAYMHRNNIIIIIINNTHKHVAPFLHSDIPLLQYKDLGPPEQVGPEYPSIQSQPNFLKKANRTLNNLLFVFRRNLWGNEKHSQIFPWTLEIQTTVGFWGSSTCFKNNSNDGNSFEPTMSTKKNKNRESELSLSNMLTNNTVSVYCVCKSCEGKIDGITLFND